LPGGEPAELEDGLPGGPEVPPGAYEITLTLPGANGDTVTAKTPVTVLADPRARYSPAARVQNYQTLLELQGMQEEAVTAVERIVRARSDLDTVLALIDQNKRPGAELDDTLAGLRKQASDLKDGLDELEKQFRTPPETKGIVYDEDKVVNRIGMAMSYVGSSHDAPSPTALTYVEIARTTLEDGLAALDSFVATDLSAFAQAVSAAGIGLFEDRTQP
jgi:hypothetical protein